MGSTVTRASVLLPRLPDRGDGRTLGFLDQAQRPGRQLALVNSPRPVARAAVLKRAAEVVTRDGTFADVPPDPSVSLELLDGTGEAEGVLIVHSSDGTSVVLTEIVFDLEPPKSALARAALRLAGFWPGP